MKKVFWFLLAIMLIQSVFALSVSPGKVKINFEPNYKGEIGLSIGASDPNGLEKSIVAQGMEMEKAFTLGEFQISEGGAILLVQVDFSKVDVKKLVPGNNRVLVSIGETAPDEAQFAALVAIRVPFDIFVPFEGVFFDAALSVNDILAGENGEVSVVVKNLGGEKIKLSPTLLILKGDEEKMRFDVNEFELGTNEEKTIARTFGSSELGDGQFTFKFVAQIGDFKVEKTVDFRVGKWELEVASAKQTYQANKDVEQFAMQVANKWNEEAKNVNAEITISNSSGKVLDFKTANFDVPASETNQTKEIKQFFEASGIGAGKYNMNVTLYFNNNVFSSMHEAEFVKSSGKMIWIIGAIVLIIIAAIIFLLLRRTKHKSKHRR